MGYLGVQRKCDCPSALVQIVLSPFVYVVRERWDPFNKHVHFQSRAPDLLSDLRLEIRLIA